MRVCTCTCMCMCVCVCVRVRVCIYMYMYACVYVQLIRFRDANLPSLPIYVTEYGWDSEGGGETPYLGP